MSDRWLIYAALKTKDFKRFINIKKIEQMEASEIKEGFIEFLLQERSNFEL